MIKKIFCGLAVILLFGSSAVSAKMDNPAVKQATDVVWAGLDYSKVKMIGVSDFNQPDIFPGMLTAWNELFMEEILEKLQKELHKTITADIDGVLKRNNRATAAQIEIRNGNDEPTSFTPEQIAAEVKSYKLSKESGVGLVLIIESMEKPEAYIDTVWFDIETREVLDVQSDWYKAGGFGFRNYWFSPVKRAIKEIK